MDSQEIGEDQSINSEAPPPLLPPQQRSERKRKREPTPDEQLAVDNAIKIINDASRKPKNPYSGFGEHIANKLLTYDDYTRSQVEFKISKLLYEADMQFLKPTQTHSLSTYTHSTHSNVTSPATTFVQDLDSPEERSLVLSDRTQNNAHDTYSQNHIQRTENSNESTQTYHEFVASVVNDLHVQEFQ